ncbi:hypothetical protein LVY72_23735 [Arthrobacter sp. I2-34]|uniref:Uncharacterized protein n=1 Tax=Arthrobacter hankyongi TaxID=2904801 RepID=A0ABS9LE99_9MICC|nr:hypothetical protein [Arthrobacter hankyongi]MCG2624906.1 hypothetical protein [Arthrobacter hankyongi]
MHPMPIGRRLSKKPAILPGISRRPLTTSQGLTFKCLRRQAGQAAARAAAIQGCTAAPAGDTVASACPPPQHPPAHVEHQQAGVLTHTPWAGWYYETDPD